MALRGTLTHWKTRLLADSLGIQPCFALGILEALWHATAELAPAGNIGRLPNQAIAMEMFYQGDADQLVTALIKSGHLEEHPVHRLVVHDWLQHADYNTKRKVERRGESMVGNGSNQRTMTRHKSIPVPEPEPVPVPEPEPVVGARLLQAPVEEYEPTPLDLARAVMLDLGISGKELPLALETLIKSEAAKPGYHAEKLRELLVASWKEYQKAIPRLSWTSTAATFFGNGLWKGPDFWPWKDGQKAKPVERLYLNGRHQELAHAK